MTDSKNVVVLTKRQRNVHRVREFAKRIGVYAQSHISKAESMEIIGMLDDCRLTRKEMIAIVRIILSRNETD